MWQVQVVWQFLSNGLKACIDTRLVLLYLCLLCCLAMRLLGQFSDVYVPSLAGECGAAILPDTQAFILPEHAYNASQS